MYVMHKNLADFQILKWNILISEIFNCRLLSACFVIFFSQPQINVLLLNLNKNSNIQLPKHSMPFSALF